MRHGPGGSMFDGPGRDGFSPSPARFGERLKEMDANKDGVITLDEVLARRDPAFARFDKNNDGVVDAAEFEAVAKESADYWIKRFIKRFDADRDGKVSKDEFAKARRERFAMRDLNDDGRIDLEDMAPGMRERIGRWRDDRAKDGKEAGKDAKEPRSFTLDRLLGRVGRQFARLDKDSDGFIDAKDLEPVAAERIAHASQRFFRRLDADRDGKVTKDEFSARAKQRFAQLDLDDDGKITEADLPPMLRGRGFLK